MKRILTRALALAATVFAAAPALAQAWPNRPISLIVPFAAGGGTDAFARPLAQQLETQLGQRVLIDNRAGAGGNTGAAAAAKATPDGYTFFVGATHHVIAPAMYTNLTYDLRKDFIPIAIISEVPHVVVVAPQKVQAKTLQEFVAAAKASPGKFNYASAGAGTAHHLAGEMFKLLTGTSLVHVPYRGAGPAMQDLVAGQIDMAFDGLGSSAGQIAGGQIRPLAVAARERVKAFPDIPTAAEAGVPGYEVATFYALFAPKGTPDEIVQRMTRELQTAFKAPLIQDAWNRQGSAIPTLTGAEFGQFVSAEIDRWAKVVKDAGIKLGEVQ
ncbi:MAG TPA: tripartite tricarboxylate transporter substrate binding protein [Microvirga sp.]